MKDIVIIAGPTAVGKTDLSIFLAKKINGELSRFYREIDNGDYTANG